jgi:hypothetical protein
MIRPVAVYATYNLQAVDGYFLSPKFYHLLSWKFKGRSDGYIENCFGLFTSSQQELTDLLEYYFGATHRQIETLLQQLQNFERKPYFTLKKCLSLTLNSRVYPSYPYMETLEAMQVYEKAVLDILTCP